jgi:hypothetical protein
MMPNVIKSLIATVLVWSFAAPLGAWAESLPKELPKPRLNRPASPGSGSRRGGALVSASLPAPEMLMGSSTVDPYVVAARKAQVPLSLLIAIAGAESGWHPWALNIGGKAYYCHSRGEAAALLSGALDADIGLMQVNFSFWGPRFGFSKEQLLDPATNLIVGAQILKMAMKGRGNFWDRASSYHSLTPEEKIRWNKAVYSHYQQYLHAVLGDQYIENESP